MRFEDFTPQQQKAITTSGKNILVSAGAGSGKTQVLTARVVHFVKDEQYQLNQFLILTFTKNAAAEMKERIRKALMEAGLPAYQDVDMADICTFDSYAFSLVKKYHFLLGVSSKASIIDQTIIDVRKRAMIEEIFERYYKVRDEKFTAMIKNFCFKDDDDIQGLVLKVYNKALLQLDTKEFLDHFVERYYNDELFEEFFEYFVSDIKEQVNGFLDTLYYLPKTVIPKNGEVFSFEGKAEQIFADLIHADTYEDIIKAVKGVEVNKTTSGYTLVGIPKTSTKLAKEDQDRLKAFHDCFDGFYGYILSLPESKEEFFEYLRKTKPYAEVIVDILKELDVRLREYKDEKSAYEFTDIAKMALDLVKDHEDVRTDLRDSLKMIMIDEYQDTSLLQDTFIHYIANNNIYMVGDVKQSIYRFRNAEVDIFIDKYNRYKKTGEGIVIDMNTNFRSRPEVLDSVNYIFKQIMSKEQGGADYAKEHQIEFGNKNYEIAGHNEGGNALSFLVSGSDTEYPALEQEAHMIARDIIHKLNDGYQVMDFDENKKPILRPCCFKDFCILMDRGGAFDTYTKVFNEYQLPLYVENDDDITTNDMVLVLTNVLRLIQAISKNDTVSGTFEIAFASVARSFIYQYTDTQVYQIFQKHDFENEPIIQQFEALISENTNLSTYELFEKVVSELDLYHKCINLGDIEKNEGYLDYFLGTFKTMSELDYTLSDFISFMENVDKYSLKIKLSSTGSFLDSITIMNIHKSKGLEFNIIYFSGLGKKFNRMDLNADFGMSMKYGLITPPVEPGMFAPIKEMNAEYELEQDTSERIRQFYVAFTRTREQMIIPFCNDDDHESLMRELNQKTYDEFITHHDLASLTEKDKFDLIFGQYIHRYINKTVFEMLCKAARLELPYAFWSLKEEEKEAFTYEAWVTMVAESKAYETKMNQIAEELYQKLYYPVYCIREAFDLLKRGQIDVPDFRYLAHYFGYELTDEFSNAIPYKKMTVNSKEKDEYDIDPDCEFDEDDDGNVTVYVLDLEKLQSVAFDEKWLSIESQILENPEYDKTPKYADYLDYLLQFFIKGHIPAMMVEKFCDILDIELSERAGLLLHNFDPSQNPWPAFVSARDLMLNPVEEYEEKDEKRDFLKAFSAAFEEHTLNNEECYFFLKACLGKCPYEEMLDKYFTMLASHDIDFATFDECLELFGYDMPKAVRDFMYRLSLGQVDMDELTAFGNEHRFCDCYILSAETLENFSVESEMLYEPLVQKLYLRYQSGEYDLKKYIQTLSLIGYEPTVSFLKEEERIQKSHYPSEMDDIVVELGRFHSCLHLNSFKSFLFPFYFYRKFRKFTLDMDVRNPELINPPKKTEHQNLEIRQHTIVSKQLDTFRPSKKIDLTTQKEVLDFGTRMHFLMEVMDFKNPDYDGLTDKEADIVRTFLSSSLMTDIDNGTTYKEYEYYDESQNLMGVIDLMVVYEDHIDIIDYKTKKLSDASYDKQVKLYMDYIRRTFDKPTNGYLYSLMIGEIRKIG